MKQLVHPQKNLFVESSNSFWEGREFHRGKKSLLLSYILSDLLIICWNKRKWEYWDCEERLQSTEFSKNIINDFRKVLNDIETVQYASEALSKNIIYEIDIDAKQKLLIDIKKNVESHGLIFKNKHPKWTSQCYEILHIFLSEQSEQWIFNSETMVDISGLFSNMFSCDFLIRRVEDWGIHYVS